MRFAAAAAAASHTGLIKYCTCARARSGSNNAPRGVGKFMVRAMRLLESRAKAEHKNGEARS